MSEQKKAAPAETPAAEPSALEMKLASILTEDMAGSDSATSASTDIGSNVKHLMEHFSEEQLQEVISISEGKPPTAAEAAQKAQEPSQLVIKDEDGAEVQEQPKSDEEALSLLQKIAQNGMTLQERLDRLEQWNRQQEGDGEAETSEPAGEPGEGQQLPKDVVEALEELKQIKGWLNQNKGFIDSMRTQQATSRADQIVKEVFGEYNVAFEGSAEAKAIQAVKEQARSLANSQTTDQQAAALLKNMALAYLIQKSGGTLSKRSESIPPAEGAGHTHVEMGGGKSQSGPGVAPGGDVFTPQEMAFLKSGKATPEQIQALVHKKGMPF